MVKSIKALVLAAGRGTRIASLALNRPKPLLEVGGIPLLVRNLELLKSHGIRKIWINLHTQPGDIKRTIRNNQSRRVSVRFSYESRLLGTAGALKKLESEFSDGTFFVLYGDNWTDCDLTQMLQNHKRSGCLGTIAVFDIRKNPNSSIAGGRFQIGHRGRILQFSEGKSERPWVNAGIYLFEPEILHQLPKGFSDFGHDIFPKLIREGFALNSYKMNGFCYALDTPEAYAKTQHAASQMK